MTLETWLAEWLKTYKALYLKKSSIERIKYTIKHVPTWLNEKKLRELKAYDIDKAISQCKFSRTRKYVYYVLTNALKKAYRLDLLDFDITAKIEPVKHKPKKGKALTKSEQIAFLRAIKGCKYRNLFEFYLYTGCRRSEALSLKWSDIDYKFKEIYIHGTKTETSERVLFLLPPIEEILKRQKKISGNVEKIFPYEKANVSHIFKKYCPTHHLHDLRHTFVTRCAENGININVAQRLAGHSDISTTLQIYTHVTSEFQKQEFMKFKL